MKTLFFMIGYALGLQIMIGAIVWFFSHTNIFHFGAFFLFLGAAIVVKVIRFISAPVTRIEGRSQRAAHNSNGRKGSETK